MDTDCKWCLGYGKYAIYNDRERDHVVRCRFCGGKKRKKALAGMFGLRVFVNDPYDEFRKEKEKVETYGYVYILRFSQHVLKIGHTRRDPSTRSLEWELPLLAYAPADDSAEAERALHTELARYRRGSYELFEVSYSEAVQIVRRLLGKIIEV